MMNLHEQHCTNDSPALTPEALAILLDEVPGWLVEDGALTRSFEFRDFHQTIAFVNALAAICHAQDHHPLMTVSYKACTVHYSTHSAGGALSANDFICAARINAIASAKAGA